MTAAREPRPATPEAWFARGVELQQRGALGEAIGAYGEALRVRPGFPEAHNNLAAALRGLRRLEEAQACVERALALRPLYPRALNNRGLIALDARHGGVAVEDFRRALALEPHFPEALHNLATALLQLRRYSEAQEAFTRLEQLVPGFPHARGNVVYSQLMDCDWRGLEHRSGVLTSAVGRGEHAATPMSFLCVSGSPALQLGCAKLYTQAFFPPAPPPSAARREPPVPGARLPGAPAKGAALRIGYLSGDLGEHAVSYLLAGVLERHDRERFETVAFSWGRRAEGAMRARLTRAFTRFIEVDELADEAVVRLMRDLGIDIAVDLCGHTEGQRTGILARRAAPIQVNFLGLPATMGAQYVDYLIADPFLIPAGREQHYAERIVRLEGGFQPNDDRRALAPESPPSAALGLPDGARVLCSFNRTCKITPAIFSVWMRLLAAVPESVLWLPAVHEAAANHLRREATARGVAAERLVFATQAPYAEYLARYLRAELFLDTAPFNGGATVSDALSMGVPVVTLAGESFAARMAGSALHALGLDELITYTLSEYEATALALARDPGRLRALRERLDRARREHPFFDTDRYRACLEAAYATMASRQVAGLPPASFTVGDATAGEVDGSSRSNGPT